MTKKVQEKNGRDDFQLRVTRSGSSQAFRRSAESCVNEIARNEFRGEKCAKSGFLKWGALRRCHVFPPTPYQVVARNHFSCALRACKKIRELYVLLKMTPDLHTLADQVTDENSLIEFISALARDREDEVAQEELKPSSPYSSGANGWECGNIQDYLGAASAWAEGSKNGLPYYTPPTNPWTRLAHILHMGKIYE
jgi:hypothetical protein